MLIPVQLKYFSVQARTWCSDVTSVMKVLVRSLRGSWGVDNLKGRTFPSWSSLRLPSNIHMTLPTSCNLVVWGKEVSWAIGKGPSLPLYCSTVSLIFWQEESFLCHPTWGGVSRLICQLERFRVSRPVRPSKLDSHSWYVLCQQHIIQGMMMICY